MENKGLEYSEYVTKESLAQQGGYGLTLKGAQHDEAWLIFMDMVNKQIPTFEDKAEALHFFPMLRTWFGLQGLCKLLWNDIEPEDNAEEDEPQKVPKHLQGYCELFAGMTGKEVTADDLLLQSERVYNFQRIFNLKMGFGTREHDVIPYRSQGPVTEEEYLSREQRYDRQIKEQLGLDPDGHVHRRKNRRPARVQRRPVREADRRRLPPPRLDLQRHPHAGHRPTPRHRQGRRPRRAARRARRHRVAHPSSAARIMGPLRDHNR